MIRRWAARVAPAILLFFAWGCGSSTPAPNATPQISGLFPSEITAGSQSFTLFVAGVQFMTGSTVQWNGSDLSTTFNSQSTQVAATVPAADVQNAGIAQVTVTNPTPGGGRSLAISFTVNPAQSGGPTITSLSPSSAALNAAAFTLTVNGTNFTSSDYVTWNGGLRNTCPTGSTCSSTQLTAQILASDLTQQMIAGVAVHTAQLGQASPSVSFAVGNAPSAAVRFPELISVSRTGKVADGQSSSPAMSSDGRYVAFYSAAKNLVSGAVGNIFLRDTCVGAANCTSRTIAVDIAADGSAPNGPAGDMVVISGDGRYVAFTSSATNLTKDQLTGEGPRVYVRDVCIDASAPVGCSPHTELVSAGSDAKAIGERPSLSADGRFIAFTAPMIPGRPTSLVMVRDTCHGPTAAAGCTPRGAIASVYEAGMTFVDPGAQSSISASGRYVVFASSVHSERQVFLRDTCLGVSASEACVPATARVSIAPDGQFGNRASGAPATSGDGRFVVFESTASNLADGSGSGRQIFLRDTCLGATAPFGCSPSTTRISGADVADAVGDAYSPAISASGRYISYIAKSENAGTASDSGNVGYIVLYDTCFGATGACSPHATELTAADSSGNVSPLTGDVRVPVPVTDDGLLAAFFTKQRLPTVRGSGLGDVFLTTTPFSAQQ